LAKGIHLSKKTTGAGPRATEMCGIAPMIYLHYNSVLDLVLPV